MQDVMIITENGYALRFNIDEVQVVGAKAAGVKAINLKADDVVRVAFIASTDSFYLLTQRGSIKRVAMDVIPVTSRANRGLQVLRDLKTKPHRVFVSGPVQAASDQANLDLFSTVVEDTDQLETLQVISNTGKTYDVILEDLSLSERTSNGSFISDSISDEGVFSAKIK